MGSPTVSIAGSVSVSITGSAAGSVAGSDCVSDVSTAMWPTSWNANTSMISDWNLLLVARGGLLNVLQLSLQPSEMSFSRCIPSPSLKME